MKKIIVTGATGMIGTALLREALSRGVAVYAVIRPGTDRMQRLPKSDRLHIVQSDLQNLSTVKGLPDDCDAFYHFAWAYTAKNYRDDPALQAENIGYTLDAVELARRCGCSVFIGAGSQAEYGQVNGVIDADTPCSPQTAYGMAKHAAGLLSRKLCDRLGMIHIWARIFSVYGCYDNRDTLIDYAVRRFLNGETAHFSAGTQPWDYLFEADAGRIFFRLGEKASASRFYRVASGRSRPLREFVDVLARQMDAEKLCCFAEPNPAVIPLGLQADISDLTADIGYTPETDFEVGISRVIDAYRRTVI